MKAPRFMKNKSNLIFSIIEKGALHKDLPKYLGEVFFLECELDPFRWVEIHESTKVHEK